MMELPPKIEKRAFSDALFGKTSEEINFLVDQINEEYDYWDKVKYKKPLPNGVTPEMLWSYVKASRLKQSVMIWDKYGIKICVTSHIQRLCHEFDMLFGSFWSSENDSQSAERKYYLASSLMEEAIYSSQMEGASTTRVVAKEMLRKNKSPQNKSQQMIVNNYNTIQYITQHRNDPLTEGNLLHIHRLMTENTLDDPNNAGRFRTNDEVVVANVVANEIVYTPPTYKEIPEFLDAICYMFNEDNPRVFLHPIIKGIVIHFMLAYMHPFVDGNGRTARALFYWYMLKENYWLTEYMSISRVIAKSKKTYEKTFRYSENDENDIGYFVAYNLRALKISFQQLTDYIQRKQKEKKAANAFMASGNVNQRQALILQQFAEDPDLVLTVKEVQTRFSVASMTARKDLSELVQQGYLQEIAINKVTRGYLRGLDFNELKNMK